MNRVEQKPFYRPLVVAVVLLFAALFFYSGLNLKNIDYGYKKQELLQHERTLGEEIDRLLAEKSSLLNLERVERIAIDRLRFQYPVPSQIFPIFETANGK